MWFFISTEAFVKLILITLVVLNILPVLFGSLWVVILILFLAMRRKSRLSYKDNLSTNPDLFFSPVNGKVVSYNSEEKMMEISVSSLSSLGIYFPCQAVVEQLDSPPNRDSFTIDYNRYNLALRSSTDEKFFIEALSFAVSPRIFVDLGDRGKALACLGYLPFGGKVKVRLPSKANMLISVGDKLKAGQTAIAGI
ncbi:MAG: hypothetical protein KC478_05600 [Bacteriovoracaceae bacterium]|nr:hypothetical protein [Bacteriovoracaceae bacterium]